MASPSKRLDTNAPGEFFVDSTCIDCDTCRWLAPATFDSAGEHSRVHTQPSTPRERENAFLALIACPTGSIGADSKPEVLRARTAFPIPIDGEVYHCGWHARESFGATSYLIRRPPERGGNVLVDSPRFNASLVARLEELGGIATIFLTHGDDVADQRRFAEHFSARRVMHADDIDERTREVEVVLEGLDEVQLDDELLALPTPGHTRGSMCLLHDDRYLFTGDHLAWSASRGHLYAFRDACWFDWATQIASMERLLGRDFEWVLPGHGRRARLDRAQVQAELARCVAWMRRR